MPNLNGPRPERWGDRLKRHVARYPGGHQAAVRLLHERVSRTAGSRTSYAALYDLDEPPKDRTAGQRAWLLLAVVEQEPLEWGITDDVLDPVMGRAKVLDLLNQSVPCLTAA